MRSLDARVFCALMLAVAAAPALLRAENAGVRDVDPAEANRILTEQPGAVLLDVRSRAEYALVGHPTGAFNLPMMFWNPASAGFEPNPRFGREAAARFDKSKPILLICRSGGRSARAAAMLDAMGYEQVYNVLEGVEGSTDAGGHRSVNGWKNRGLPYTYAVDDAHRYHATP